MKTISINRYRMSLLLLIAVACLLTHTTLHGQVLQKKLKTGFAQGYLKNVLSQLEKKGGIGLTYSPSRIPAWRTGPFAEEEKTIAAWLTAILAGSGVTFRVSNAGKIILVKQSLPAKTTPPVFITVYGSVYDTSGKPLAKVSIEANGKALRTQTANDGRFSIERVEAGTLLTFSYVGLKTVVVKAESEMPGPIILPPSPGAPIDGVTVSTGYTRHRKDRTAGSVNYAGNDLLNNSISTSITSRLDGIISGLQSVKNIPNGSTANESTLSVRGRSTLYSNAQPLIILDNFPYEGSLENLNPADVEYISVLKDAAAASVWGVFSGNGVIVISTRKGKRNQAPKTTLMNNFTLLTRPDLDYLPALNSKEYIDVEQQLFKNGYYNSTNSYSYLSAAVEIMSATRRGTISSIDSAQRIQQLLQTDTKTQLKRYFYRPGFYQQHAISLSGGNDFSTYYLSAGFDRNLQQLTRNGFDRSTFSIVNTFQPSTRFDIGTSVSFIQSYTRMNNNGGPFLRPYDALVDANGQPAAVPVGLRPSYKDTAGRGRLLDWNYRPLEDLNNSNNLSRLNEYRASIQLGYQPFKALRLSGIYQYYNGQTTNESIKNEHMYEFRNLVNSYTRLLPDGEQQHPVPLGGMADIGRRTGESHNLRALMRYVYNIDSVNELSFQAGYDMRVINVRNITSRLYGYDGITFLGTPVDYSASYPLFFGRSSMKIPNRESFEQENNNFLSWYATASYNHSTRISAVLNYRVDASNLFGTQINKKGIALWSAGLAYALLPQLKLRGSIGYSGNVNTSLPSVTTISQSFNTNRFNTGIASLASPTNSGLRAEQLRTINAGIDFKLLAGRISGTLEAYRKDGSNLIGLAPSDPTNGFSEYIGNYARMRTNGVDLTLTTLTRLHQVNWNATLLFSYNKDIVTRVKTKEEKLSELMSIGLLHPQQNRPLYSLYSFRINRLNNAGQPLVLFNGAETTAYGDVLSSTNTANLEYSGPVNPTWYGALRNSFSWKKFTLNVNFSFKGGYVFKRPGINYNGLYQGLNAGHSDIALRWQNPGDELHTTVPVMSYPSNPERDVIYSNSTLMAEPGAHVRLKDIYFSYELTRQRASRLPFTGLKLYTYINNLGILWRANKVHIDPDYVPYAAERILPDPRTYGLGMQLIF